MVHGQLKPSVKVKVFNCPKPRLNITSKAKIPNDVMVRGKPQKKKKKMIYYERKQVKWSGTLKTTRWQEDHE